MIIESEKIAFIHIPKCGGSSVEQMLHQTFGDAGDLWSGENQERYRLGRNRQHWTLKELAARFDLKGWRIFAVIRDPLQRARSEFAYQIENEPRVNSLPCYRDRDLAEALCSGHLFRLGYVKHETAAHDFIQAPPGVKIEILRLESITEDLKALGGKWGIDWAPLPHQNVSKKKQEWKWGPSEFYELEGRWGRDFQLGDYPTPYPVIDQKKIWIFWEQGWKSAPRVALAAKRSWKTLNPEYQIIALDARSAEYKAASHLWAGKQMSATHRSDLCRLWLLVEHGGIWADATVLCMRPLRSWLGQELATSDFFVFQNQPVATWFMAARKGSAAARKWLSLARRYWKGRKKAGDYYWLHGLFEEIGHNHSLSACHWAKVGPHMLLPYSSDLNGAPGPHFFHRIISQAPPMLKLTRHITPHPASKFDWLLKSFE